MAATGGVMVPKGPRAQPVTDEPSVAELRAALFAMPLPPNPTGTRTYPTTTALGRIMRLRGLSINEVAKVEGGPSARQIGDALAQRRELSGDHKRALSVGLGIDARLL
jgi:hypothetical protein